MDWSMGRRMGCIDRAIQEGKSEEETLKCPQIDFWCINEKSITKRNKREGNNKYGNHGGIVRVTAGKGGL